jgi:hypothetical protein
LKEQFDEALVTYGTEDKNGRYKVKNYMEVLKDNWENRTGLWDFLKTSTKDYFQWRLVKKYESAAGVYQKGSEMYDTVEDKAKTVAEKVEGVGTGAKEAYKSIRLTPELSRQRLKVIKSNFEAGRDKALKLKNPTKIKEAMQKLSNEMLDGFQDLNPKVLRHSMKKKTLPLSFGKASGITTLRLTVGALFDSIRSGDVTTLSENLTSAGFVQEAKEMLIPIYGTVKSYERLDDEYSETPSWARKLDLAVSAGGDALMVGGAVAAGVGVGFGGIGAIPGLFSMGAGYLLRTVGKGIVKLSTKAAVKIQQKFATKTARRQTAKNTSKTLGKEAGARGAFELALQGIQKTYEKLYPDGVISEVKLKLFGQLSPQQRRLLQLTGQPI